MAEGFSFEDAQAPPAPKGFSWEDAQPQPKGFSFADAQPPKRAAPEPDEVKQGELANQLSQQEPAGAIARIGKAAIKGGAEAFGQPGTILSPEGQEALDAMQRQGGVKGALAGLGSTVAGDIGTAGGVLAGAANAGFGAYQAGAQQTGEELGHPQLGRDIAALPEAFMGMPGALAGIGDTAKMRALGIERPPVEARAAAAEQKAATDLANVEGKKPPPAAAAATPPPPPAPMPPADELAHVTAAQQQLEQIAKQPTQRVEPRLNKPQPTAPEPEGDINAQVKAMLDPQQSTKQAVFVAAGSPVPAVPKDVYVVPRTEGTLLTTDPVKAQTFRQTQTLDDQTMAGILGYPETKAQAQASGSPTVVQAVDKQGNVQAEAAASPQSADATKQAIASQAPGATVETTTPEAALRARAARINPATDFAMMKPGDLKLAPETFQYKTSNEKGETGEYAGVSKWEPVLANPITAFQGLNGDLSVVNGHQRYGIATRAEAAGQPDVYIPTRIFKEADGYTPDFMRVIGAYQNLAEGSGSAMDAARVLRGRNALPEGMELPSLPPKKALVQQAQALAKLSPNAWGMVENGVVPPAYAMHVGELIADPLQQEAAMGLLSKSDISNPAQARILVQDVRDSGFLQGTQGGLFGDEDFAKSIFPERAKVLDGAMASLRRSRGLYKAAVEGEEELTKAGNQLNPEANIQGKTQNEQLIDLIQRAATTKGPISDALTAAANDLAAGQPRPRVQSAFLAAVRKVVGGGKDAGIQLSDLYGGDRLAEQTTRVEQARRLPKPPTAGPDLFADQQREPPVPRGAPEPNYRNDPRQQTLAGMQPSAVQAQASRDAQGPKSSQLPPDQGLFARPETVQPELPKAPPPTSRWGGWLKQEGVDFQDQLAQIQGLGHQAAADYVRNSGIGSGFEHGAIVDNVTGQTIHAGTEGHGSSLSYGHEWMALDNDAYTFHHNHPGNTALSDADMAMLANPGVSHIVAHAHDGDISVASIGPELKSSRPAFSRGLYSLASQLMEWHNEAQDVASRLLGRAIGAGEITQQAADKLWMDISNRILDARGAIDYTSTYVLPDAIKKRFASIMEKNGYGKDDIDRSTGTVRPDEALAKLHSGVPGEQGQGSPGGAARATEGPGISGPTPSLREHDPLNKLYSFPGALFDPDVWRMIGTPIARIGSKILSNARDTATNVSALVAPMTQGTETSRSIAFKYANAQRQVVYAYAQLDRHLEKNYSPTRREAMGRAMDNQSVFEQRLAQMDPQARAAQEAQLRQQFDATGTGIAGLGDKERQAVDTLARLGQTVWERMQQRKMVSPGAEGLPYYFTRQMLGRDDTGKPIRAGTGTGGVNDVQKIGANLSTSGPMQREYLTPEETEAAGKAKLGPQAFLLRDIRSVVNGLSRNERAIAGTDMINSIKEVGRSTGTNLVVEGDIPGLLQPADYFTINHPSFRRWTGAGFTQIHIDNQFKGPLESVLSTETGKLYNSVMGAKGLVMGAIMWSPYMHLAVELGRALPVLPGKVATLKAVRDGSTLRNDTGYMRQAINDGLAPIGQGWAKDPVRIQEAADPSGRSRFVQMLTAWRDSIAEGAGKAVGAIEPAATSQAVKDFTTDALKHPHQTLLWDQVFNLQVGIYDALRDQFEKKGLDQRAAGINAAHVANRYAGALPPENMSKFANQMSNLLLFSRSFTLGNLGVMKDIFNGAPQHVRDLITTETNPATASLAQSMLKRKARAAFIADIGMFTIGTGVLQMMVQTGYRAMSGAGLPAAAQSVYEEWLDHVKDSFAHIGENPLNAFGILPQYYNEPGKQDRVYAGDDENGRGVYLRIPAGKVGEEFLGWMTHPGPLLMQKLSPLARPVMETLINADEFGRPVYKPSPQTVGDYTKNAGRIAMHILSQQGPISTMQGAYELSKDAVWGQQDKTSPTMSAMKVMLPMTGMAQVSSGHPMGPEAGKIAGEKRSVEWEKMNALPGAKDMANKGDPDGAIKTLMQAGWQPRDAAHEINRVINTSAGRAALQRWQAKQNALRKATGQ